MRLKGIVGICPALVFFPSRVGSNHYPKRSVAISLTEMNALTDKYHHSSHGAPVPQQLTSTNDSKIYWMKSFVMNERILNATWQHRLSLLYSAYEEYTHHHECIQHDICSSNMYHEEFRLTPRRMFIYSIMLRKEKLNMMKPQPKITTTCNVWAAVCRVWLAVKKRTAYCQLLLLVMMVHADRELAKY